VNKSIDVGSLEQGQFRMRKTLVIPELHTMQVFMVAGTVPDDSDYPSMKRLDLECMRV
jgi:hypothetical protein